MSQTIPQAIYLKDYTPPTYAIDTVNLYFNLQEDKTLVTATLAMRREEPIAATEPLILNGEHLQLQSIAVDDRVLTPAEYKVDAESLTLFSLPAAFTLKIVTEIKPQENTALEGLYQSNGNYCTQCEAHGFRRITYFLDRPDVMAVYTTTIEADKARYPVLLSNGNLVASEDKDSGRHAATWHDPFKKPCYLFALVAGDLTYIEDKFITQSQCEVTLRIYVEHGNQDKCQHAMTSLKNAMRWDEEKYGREYDLDIFMIVAVSDFNMGAMENKGLNIFNAKYILAKPETATDTDFGHIEGVVGHEYFHNWTGNRITCRNWFQLSLKEGLTVFRDHEFSADMGSRAVQRINNVRTLRTAQFVEDAGPLAHPVRPETYIEMNNFYTATVYEKGAEVIRMIHTILGADNFRKGMDLYFTRHDGQAVTCDDFVQAMEDASQIDLTQFRLWYSQAGTPQLTVEQSYDAANKIFSLQLKQHCPPTPGQANKKTMHIPVTIALFDQQGQQLTVAIEGTSDANSMHIINLQQAEQTVRFLNIEQRPMVSLLRNFSAPVKLISNTSEDDLLFLLAHDSDLFNRWEAGQQLAIAIMLQLIAAWQAKQPLTLDVNFVSALRKVLHDPQLDKALIAQILTLPSEVYLGQLLPEIDVDAIVAVRRFMREQLASQLQTDFWTAYQQNTTPGVYEFSAPAAAKRSLKNICLQYLLLLPTTEFAQLALQQMQQADNMTDQFAALTGLANRECAERDIAIAEFYTQWQGDSLVLDKWFAVQATADVPDTLNQVKALLDHPAFSMTNPNKVRALIGAFASNNFNQFHNSTGVGYQLLAEQVVKLNATNPQVAARIVEPLTRWKRYDSRRQALMKEQLVFIQQQPHLSKDVYEIVNKSLLD